MKLDLTDSEWISLIDGESDDSQLPKCCANVSSLRDVFVDIVRGGRKEDMTGFQERDLKQRLVWLAGGHDLTPLIQNICEQIGFDPKNEEHTQGYVE